MEDENAIVIQVLNEDKNLQLELSYDSNIKDWINAFRTILFHITFTENTIDKYIKSPYDTEDELDSFNNMFGVKPGNN